MVKRTTITRVISFLLLPACGALCQSEIPLPASPQQLYFDGSETPKAQRRDFGTPAFLPDAPSVQPPTQAEKFHSFVEEARSPLTFGAVAINVAIVREEEEQRASKIHSSFKALYGPAVLQKESSVFFSKYLYPSLLRQDPRYHASTSDSILGRAAYAATRILITRSDSGKKTLNTSYFLGAFTAAAIATAYRPYWAQSPSTMFTDVGSTMGSDVGINIFREFWPGIRQILKHHSPKSVKRIEEAW